MKTITLSEAQSDFGELLDSAQDGLENYGSIGTTRRHRMLPSDQPRWYGNSTTVAISLPADGQSC